MKKYKKIITGLILGLICGILPFLSVAKVEASSFTTDDIKNIDDLRETIWQLKSPVVNLTDYSFSQYQLFSTNSLPNLISYQYGENIIYSDTSYNDTVFSYFINPLTKKYSFGISKEGEMLRVINASGVWDPIYDVYPRYVKFNYWPNGECYFRGDATAEAFVIDFLKVADFISGPEPEPEPTTRTIPFRISLITNVFGEQLEYINSSIINLPVFDDTVSFTVSFENNKMITGQVEHPESADEIGELTFSNGERVFYTIYYNETNIDFKLYFYGEQLFLYEAVMYNTEVLDSGGNYQATVATYSEGISEQEMQTLKNSGIYQASFDITIPQEEELVSDAQLMLEIGILEGSEPPGFDNITNIMTGIFTLVSSFLSIQLGFITLGQIIGLVLAIGVIFFIFYVWNGGRNGN